MSNAETPAEKTGGNTATSESGSLAAIPPRIRVHALGKLLGKTSKELLEKLSELGESTRSAQSSVSREVALKLADGYGITELAAPAEEPPGATAVAPQPSGPGPQASPGAPAGLFTSPQPPVTSDTPSELAAGPAFSGGEAPGAPQQPVFAPPAPMFVQPEAAPKKAAPKRKAAAEKADDDTVDSGETEDSKADDQGDDDGEDAGGRRRRRRGRRGRGRGKGGDEGTEDSAGDEKPSDADSDAGSADADEESDDQQRDDADADDDGQSRRRRRRRRRKSGSEDGSGGSGAEDPPNTVVHVRESGRSSDDQVRSVRGSTRLEAKRQRRRDGREAGRRRAPILSEAEFLARRESVARTMVVKEHSAKGDRTTQIGVLEDDVLVEHFVTSSGSGSIVGNVYLGRVQNVLPSMEAAFVDIGRGRNAVLYAGEVDWDAAGLEGKSRKIEQALSTGDPVLVQVTKDPVGHKGARLTTQISLPGRFLVYVPGGGATGISRKLPENERKRLKDILKRIVPEDAGVIIRTASEGISEEELERDVRRLQAQWETISEKSAKSGKGGKGSGNGKGKKNGPTLLYEEPDLLVKVVRDLFTGDFAKLVVQGSVAWETIDSYVQNVAPELADRVERYTGNAANSDVFHDYRIDEQITKALDRKVWLPSGGYLVIDRTEAMTVIDVNTGKFTGSGGNLEETVTRNNLESAEEIVRQLRLRDIGGIIVIDFIDMVLESNRDLVLRRLTECLSRDRTRHQVAEVTSLGLVQMTRKRVGTGLLEAYSTPCEHCKGRGVVVTNEPHAAQISSDGGKSSGGGRKRAKADVPVVPEPTPEQRESVAKAAAAMASAASKSKPATDGEAPAGEPAPAETAQADAEPVAAADPVQAIEPEVAAEPAPEPAAAQPEPEPAAAQSEQEPEVPVPAVRTVRRRPRRAASRPAGPPVDATSADQAS